MASPAKLKPFTEEVLREWCERDRHRKDLEREARALKAENDLIAKDLLAALKANDQKSITRGSFIGEIETKPGTVSWAEEFIRSVGAEAAAELRKMAASEVTERAVIREVT